MASRRFARAVAFHGFKAEAGVLIGGTAPDQVKQRVRDAIARVLPTDLDVRVAQPDEKYAGDDPDNIVNRLSPCGGIQIEQGATPRDDHGGAIADAVADVLRPRSPRDLEWIERRDGAAVGEGPIDGRRSAPLAPTLNLVTQLLDIENHGDQIAIETAGAGASVQAAGGSAIGRPTASCPATSAGSAAPN